DRIVKHYARELIDPELSAGPVPSYLARKTLVEQSLGSPPPWFWETDFLDDPQRPGAVLDLATIPRRVAAILASSPGSAERLHGPFRTSIEKIYGISLETLERRRA
ncbi:MAG TPA: deoxyribonuclease, partial [Thermoplasmata archaeon]|nr:deoxyribonuclease [Thermoplasmata archaeon]